MANTLQTTGWQLLQKPAIKAALEVEQRRHAEKADITAEKVLRDIEEARKLAIDAGNYSAAIKASELQGKHLRMWVERVEHTTTLSELSDDELDRLIAECEIETRVIPEKL